MNEKIEGNIHPYCVNSVAVYAVPSSVNVYSYLDDLESYDGERVISLSIPTTPEKKKKDGTYTYITSLDVVGP